LEIFTETMGRKLGKLWRCYNTLLRNDLISGVDSETFWAGQQTNPWLSQRNIRIRQPISSNLIKELIMENRWSTTPSPIGRTRNGSWCEREALFRFDIWIYWSKGTLYDVQRSRQDSNWLFLLYHSIWSRLFVIKVWNAWNDQSSSQKSWDRIGMISIVARLILLISRNSRDELHFWIFTHS
jgi:hypothetical protein